MTPMSYTTPQVGQKKKLGRVLVRIFKGNTQSTIQYEKGNSKRNKNYISMKKLGNKSKRRK